MSDYLGKALPNTSDDPRIGDDRLERIAEASADGDRRAEQVAAIAQAAVQKALTETQQEVDQHLADCRDAAILNTLQEAMRQAGTDSWTAELVGRWRVIRAHTDATAYGSEGEVVPAGFGPLVQTKLASKITAISMAAAQKIATAVATPKSGTSEAPPIAGSTSSEAQAPGSGDPIA